MKNNLMYGLLVGLLCGCEAPPAPSADAAPAPMQSAIAATSSASSSKETRAPGRPAAPAIPAPADVAQPPSDATKTASGLSWKLLSKGAGADRPTAKDRVKVHYTGWSADGTMFDSSVARGEPTSFALDQVIPGWTEGVQLIAVGDKARFWIPGSLAYGDGPSRRGEPVGQLCFEIELLDIVKPPAVPEDVSAPPATATKTKSGLAYRVLTKGTGTKHPASTDRVEVHYSGWTTDGKMFDSSVARGEPTSFRLDQVIPGWTEGVQLMVQGEKTRFWIPGNLAYGDKPKRPGAPAGMLVFDVELLRVP